MKLIDAIKKETGKPFEIPNCSRDDLPEFFIEMGFTTGVEIGVDKGEFTEKFAQVGLNIYAVDPWKSYNDYTDSRGQERLDFIFEHTNRLLTPYQNAKIIRKTSMEALNDFEDRSLDFVYIDGNHQLKYIIQDLVDWSKKVKVGGIISGHDYIYTDPRTQAGICHVIFALDAYTKAYKIDNWYLLGRRKADSEEKRDKFRSWMFVNKEFEFRK